MLLYTKNACLCSVMSWDSTDSSQDFFFPFNSSIITTRKNQISFEIIKTDWMDKVDE